jgi:protein-L-isoaspartate(D-aspartate) O-methyltransferase
MEPSDDMNASAFEANRKAMVDSQLRPNAVSDVRVLDAMSRVAREDYVPPAYRNTAYADIIIPLDRGFALNPPMVVGRLLNEAHIAATDALLIVGSATGYTQAIAKLLAGSVSVIDPQTAAAGHIEGSFDAIVIDGAVEHVPDALIEALKLDGRLATGIVEAGVTRLAIGRKGGSGFGLVAFADADIVVLPEFSQPRVFAF